MARIRSVKPELRTSEKVSSWPIPLRYFWILLWGYCDDYGVGRDNARLIVADAFPLDDDVDVAIVGGWMDELEASKVISRYEVDGTRYFCVVNWAEHQKISHPSKRVLPAPPIGPEQFASVSGDSPEAVVSLSVSSGEMERGNGAGEASGDAPPQGGCSKHPKGTDKPCVACMNVRLAAQATGSSQSVKPTVPGIVSQRDCPRHPGWPHPSLPAGCARCEEEGAVAA